MNPKVAAEREKAVYSRLSLNLKALEKKIEEKTCRVCFCGEEEAVKDPENPSKPAKLLNPLISACLCTGSSKYVHLECL